MASHEIGIDISATDLGIRINHEIANHDIEKDSFQQPAPVDSGESDGEGTTRIPENIETLLTVEPTMENTNADCPVPPDSIEFVDPVVPSPTKVEYLFEHQRWYIVGGWVQLNGLWRKNNDPPTFTTDDVTVSAGPWDECELENEDDWSVIEDSFTEEGGWISASDWDRLGGGENAWGEGTGVQFKEGKPVARSTDRVRRRLWKRKHDHEIEASTLNATNKLSPNTVAATDGATAKEMFFEALGKLNKKQGLLCMLDGSAWIRLVRRDTSHYREWVKAKALAVMRVGGGGGWLLAYPSLHILATPLPIKPSSYSEGVVDPQEAFSQAPRGARVIAPSSPESLRELCCGCLHACAAYGYPMAKGWLGSVKQGASLFTWRRLKIINNDVVRGIDDKTHNDAVRQVVGSLFDVLTANWSSATFMPVWYLGVDHALKWIVLSVRGTLNSTDMLTDLSVGATPLGGGHVHRGVLEAALRVFAVIVEPLSQARKSWPTYRVVCCGHSLGGGIAALTCSMLRGIEEGRDATCISIGPIACVSQDTDVSLHVKGGSFSDFTTSVILGMDPAPRLCVSHVERLVQDLSDSTITATAASAAASVGDSLMGAFRSLNRKASEEESETEERQDEVEENASQSQYISKDKKREQVEEVRGNFVELDDVVSMMEDKLSQDDDEYDKVEGREVHEDDVTLVSPGILLHVDDEIELASSPSVVAFPVHSREYDRVPLSYSFMSYHLPQRYLAALLTAAEIPSVKLVVDDLHSHSAAGPRISQQYSTPTEESSQDVEMTGKDPGTGYEINETQFMIRFEHVSSAFDIAQCPKQSPSK